MGVDTTDGNKTARSNNLFPANVGKGIYWPSLDDDAGSMTRKLHGEIPLISDLKPSFVFPRISLTVRYLCRWQAVHRVTDILHLVSRHL